MKIGLIIACEDDILNGLKSYGTMTETVRGVFDVKTFSCGNNSVSVIKSGVGEICAAQSAQLLISEFACDTIVNVGVVGALNEDFGVLSTVFVKDVVHYDFDTSACDKTPKGRYLQFDDVAIKTDEELLKMALKAADLPVVRCCSGDKFIDGFEKKAALKAEFNADICDMESAGILIACKNMSVPCLMIKAVSDSATGGAEEFAALESKASEKCLDVLKALLQ